MDLKIKSKAWVGSMYQKFEAMCHDVDDFVSKDTVKYVGNQVETVGVGVKKIYSDVVQDLLPPMDPLVCKAQVMIEKPNDAIGAYFKSIVGIKEKSLYVSDEKPTGEQKVLDLSENCSSSISCEPADERQYLCSLGSNPSEVVETDLTLDHNGDGVIEDSNSSSNKNVASEEPPFPQKISSLEDRTFYESSLQSCDDYHMDTTLHEVTSPASLHYSGFKSPQEDRTICNSSSGETECVQSNNCSDKNVSSEEQPVAQNLNVPSETTFPESSENSTDDYHIDTALDEVLSPTALNDSGFESPQGNKRICNSSSDEIEGVQSNITSDKNIENEEQPVSQNISSTEDANFSGSTLDSTDNHHITTTLLAVSLPTSLYGSGFKFPQEDRTTYTSSSEEIESVESNISSDKVVLSTESFNMPESLHTNPTQNAKNPTVGHTCIVSNIKFSSSVPTLASDNEDVGLLFTISKRSFLSLSNDAYRDPVASFVVGSSGSRSEECSGNPPFKALTSSSVIGRMDNSIEDIADPTMESIDLSDKTAVNETCIVTENRLFFPVSGRARSFGSYKKLLKDAFAMRKRLTKEYEQLAIWYGDIDAEASQHFGSLPSPPETSIHSLKSPADDTWESEWELL